MIYFTSDLHFNHKNIIKYDVRPFKDINEMNFELIKRWNAVVNTHDIVYVLGDFAFGSPRAWYRFTEQLHGDIILIRGNHDRGATAARIVHAGRAIFKDIKDIEYLRIQEEVVVLSHYPYMIYDKQVMRPCLWLPPDRGRILLHGHIHRGPQVYATMINVNTTLWDYTPISLKKICDIIKKIKLDKYA